MIKLTEISKSYGQKTVFEAFSCVMEENAVTCIMGASGGGKTTLLRLMLGLELPDNGCIEGFNDLQKSVVFQEDRLCENLNAAANIRLVCRKPAKTGSIADAMNALGFPEGYAKRPVRLMSGGEKRRVAILRALAADYDVLFMDEPFKGLDTETKKRAIQYVKEQTKGKTVIFVTHDISECEAMGGMVIAVG